jgi:ribonuclease VapC
LIVLDTSAVLALLLDEPEADRIFALLAGGSPLSMSAATLTECLVVAARKGLSDLLADFLAATEVEIHNLTEAAARQAGAAYTRWGKGFHPARLNYGDCFAYGLATELNASLLYVGGDFSHTDIKPALTA